MEKYFLVVVSAFNHQENFLSSALESMVKSGAAVEGLDGNREYLIRILYDKNNNPYLLFSTKHLEDVKKELKKRIIKLDEAFEINSFEQVQMSLDSEVHREIQKTYTPQLLHTINLN